MVGRREEAASRKLFPWQEPTIGVGSASVRREQFRNGTRRPEVVVGITRDVDRATLIAFRRIGNGVSRSAFVEANADKSQALFDRVAARDSAKALDLLARLAEFVIPKLASTD